MLDPKMMDEQLGIDRHKIASRYQQMNQPEQQSPEAPVQNEVPDFDVDMSYDGVPTEDEYNEVYEKQPEEPVNSDSVDRKKAEQRPPRLSRPNKAFATDNPLFEGGPLESQLLAWKKQFKKVYMSEHEGEFYIWRVINRFEYKEVMSVGNTNELSREEMICEICTLFPFDYSYEHMVNEAGGIPSLLAEQIMQKSGFTRKARVVAL